MEDIEKLNEQFLHIQGLLSKKDFAAAIELLDRFSPQTVVGT